MELVDMRDLGSRAFSVWVRVPSGAPAQKFPSPLRFRLCRKLRCDGNFFAFSREPCRWVHGLFFYERRRTRDKAGKRSSGATTGVRQQKEELVHSSRNKPPLNPIARGKSFRLRRSFSRALVASPVTSFSLLDRARPVCLRPKSRRFAAVGL